MNARSIPQLSVAEPAAPRVVCLEARLEVLHALVRQLLRLQASLLLLLLDLLLDLDQGGE